MNFVVLKGTFEKHVDSKKHPKNCREILTN